MKKRKKIKKGPIKFIALLLAIGGTSYILINKDEKAEKVSSEVDKLMAKENISKENYSKTLEYVLLNNIYNETYLNEYKDIEFNK